MNGTSCFQALMIKAVILLLTITTGVFACAKKSYLYNIGMRYDSSIANSAVLGKALMACYGNDSVSAWCERGLNIVASPVIDSASCFVKFYRFRAKVGDDVGNQTSFHVINEDAISNYLVSHGIKFSNCYDPEYVNSFINRANSRMEGLERFMVEYSNRDTISVCFPGLLKMAGFPDSVYNPDVVMQLISKPAPFTSLLLKGDDIQTVPHKYIRDYNQAIIYNTLIYLFGDMQVYLWTHKGLDLNIEIFVDNAGNPLNIRVLNSNIDINPEMLSEEIFSFLKFWGCKMNRNNSVDLKEFVEIKFKDEHSSPFWEPTPIEESNLLIRDYKSDEK